MYSEGVSGRDRGLEVDEPNELNCWPGISWATSLGQFYGNRTADFANVVRRAIFADTSERDHHRSPRSGKRLCACGQGRDMPVSHVLVEPRENRWLDLTGEATTLLFEFAALPPLPKAISKAQNFTLSCSFPGLVSGSYPDRPFSESKIY